MYPRNLADRVLGTDGSHLVIATPACSFCGETGSILLTETEVLALEDGTPIQAAVARLDKSTREQFISGIHSSCWESLFGSLEE